MKHANNTSFVSCFWTYVCLGQQTTQVFQSGALAALAPEIQLEQLHGPVVQVIPAGYHREWCCANFLLETRTPKKSARL